MFLLKKPRRMCVPQPQKERRAPLRWPRPKVEGSMLTLEAGRGLASGHSRSGGFRPGNQLAAYPGGEREVESWLGGCARRCSYVKKVLPSRERENVFQSSQIQQRASVLVKANLFAGATCGNYSGSQAPLSGNRICSGTGCISACGYGMRIEASAQKFHRQDRQGRKESPIPPRRDQRGRRTKIFLGASCQFSIADFRLPI